MKEKNQHLKGGNKPLQAAVFPVRSPDNNPEYKEAIEDHDNTRNKKVKNFHILKKFCLQ